MVRPRVSVDILNLIVEDWYEGAFAIVDLPCHRCVLEDVSCASRCAAEVRII